jgi:hypothetical protein
MSFTLASHGYFLLVFSLVLFLQIDVDGCGITSIRLTLIAWFFWKKNNFGFTRPVVWKRRNLGANPQMTGRASGYYKI